MNIAVDREAIARGVYGAASIDSTPVFAGLPESYYTPIENLPASTKAIYEYDPEKARQLLAETDYPDGFDTNIVTRSDRYEYYDIISMVSAYWAEIGVNVEVKAYEVPAYEAIRHGQEYDQMCIGNGMCDPPLKGMDFYTNPILRSNDSAVDDPWFTAEIARATQMDPGPEREALTRELSYYYTEQCWFLSLPAPVFYTYHWPWVKNYYGEVHEGGDRQVWMLASMWIDQDLKESMGY